MPPAPPPQPASGGGASHPEARGAGRPLEVLQALLDGLDPEQQAAVTAPLGPVRIAAGAGTGKTRTVSHRIAYQHHTRVMPAERVLAVTHSTKAAGELSDRLRVLGIDQTSVRTFHSAALRMLRFFWSATGRPGSGPQVLSDATSAIRVVMAGLSGSRPGQLDGEVVRAYAAEVGWAHAQLVSPRQYPAAAAAANRGAEHDLDLERVAAVYARYEDHKADRGLLDFDDLLTSCTRMLREDDAVAAQVRGGYLSFLVDEYQDTDPAQQQLLRTWLGDRDTVCVVGDPTQAIFGFKGADPSLLGTFDDAFPGAVTITLDRNYRSTPQVAEAANAVAVGAVNLGQPQVTLRGQQPDGPVPAAWRCESAEEELATVTARVSELLADGVPASEVAVLHRYRAQGTAIQAALVAADIPVNNHTALGFFDAEEVRRPLRWFAQAAAEEPGVAPDILMAEALDAAGFDEAAPPAPGTQARTRHDHQLALLDMVRTLAGQRYNASRAAAELDRRATSQATAARSGVTVTTVHAAKGLEWDAVIVAHLADGSLPAAHSVGPHAAPDAVAEEQRLLYVAVTRARRWLDLTWSRQRPSGGSQAPSRFWPLLAPHTAART